MLDGQRSAPAYPAAALLCTVDDLPAGQTGRIGLGVGPKLGAPTSLRLLDGRTG